MARASAQGENAAVNGLDGTGTTNVVGYTNVHTGDPGTTGANEYAGSTRQATTWNAGSGGAKTNAAQVTYTTSGASAASYFGCYSGASGANYSIGGQLSSAVTAVTIVAAAGALSLGAA